MNLKLQIESDIWDWIKNYLEVDHKFYDYNFPPCPYARGARLKNQVNVVAWESGGMIDFINHQVIGLIEEKKFNVCVMVFPTRAKYFFWLVWAVNRLNKNIISKDFYAQYGTALKTRSKYSDCVTGPYFIVIVNRLSDVLSGFRSLLKTDYYTPWKKHHYTAVVTRRQRLYEKYSKGNNYELD
jgi:hypothetical protein